MRKTGLFIFFVLFIIQAQSQSYLYLKKLKGSFERRYYVSDTIRFSLKGSQNFTRGGIQSFTDSSFFIHNTEIVIDDIEKIDVNRGFVGNSLIIGGLALPLLDIVNQSYPPTREVMTISGSLIGGALILKFFQRKYFRPGKKYKMEVIVDD